MVFVKKIAIFSIFFLSNIGQENVFYDILQRENAFQGYKNKKFKKSKIWQFSKRVNPWFLFKNCHFSIFILRQHRPETYLLRYSRTKNAFLRYKNKKLKKWINWHFFKGFNPWFWSKNGHFFNFGGGNIGQENIFYDILERKTPFYASAIKTRS